jgi:hypothetical protein
MSIATVSRPLAEDAGAQLATRPVTEKPRRQRKDGVLAMIALVIVILAVGAAFAWRFTGGRLLIMETPSMCPAVCVGSLVADQPLRGALHPGELISFHPPGSTQIYTHKISALFANGMIQTRGIANPTHDPWLITRADIVGRVVWTAWGLGWALKALPMLAVGVLAWVLVRGRVSAASRRAWDRLWMTALAVLPLWALSPLVRGQLIEVTVQPGTKHLGQARVVNTGLLSAAFHPVNGGRAVGLGSAHVGLLSGPLSKQGAFYVHETLVLRPWGWALLIAIIVSPLLAYFIHIWRNDEAPAAATSCLEAEPA